MVCTAANVQLHSLTLASTVVLQLRHWKFASLLGQQRQMYVRKLFFLPSVMLMNVSATPTIEYFSQGTAIYMGGSSNAFFGRYPAPILHIVSHDWYLVER